MQNTQTDQADQKTVYNKRGRFRPNRNLRMIIGVIIITGILSALFKTGMFDAADKSSIITYASDSKTGYRSYGNGYIQYTKDGAKFFTKSGKQEWNDPYVMTSPIVSQKGDYTAVFETGGRSVRVYNERGIVYNIQTEDPVQSTAVSECGYIGVITYGDSYSVSVYSTSGSLIFQRIEAESGVSPLCCDISPDGEVVAIAYVDTTGAEINAKIGLFYVDAQKGAEYADSMYAAVEKKEEIVFALYFISNNDFIAVGDRNVAAISSAGTEDWSVEVTNEILGAGLCGDQLAMVYGGELPDKDGQDSGTVVLISSKGKLKKGYCIGAEPEFFAVSDGGVVVESSSNYYGIDSNGKMVWNLNDTANLNGIYPTDNVKRCIYTTKTWSVMADMTNFDSSDYNAEAERTSSMTDSGDSSTAESEDASEEMLQENNQNNTVSAGEDIQS